MPLPLRCYDELMRSLPSERPKCKELEHAEEFVYNNARILNSRVCVHDYQVVNQPAQ